MKLRQLLTLFFVLLAGCATHPNHSYAPPLTELESVFFSQQSDELVDFYEQWKGTPYKLGGSSKSSIDCSAFVQVALQALYSELLPRTTLLQSDIGVRMNSNQLIVGDLVFFKTSLRNRHVGIYVGNSTFMHASTSKGVTLSHLESSYWSKHYWHARRVL